jgi:hypothetical protein
MGQMINGVPSLPSIWMRWFHQSATYRQPVL